jgi:hypothetical protein
MLLIPCTAPIVTSLIVPLSIAVIAQFIFLWKNPSKRYRHFVLVQVVLIALMAGAGLYRFSPLFSDTNILRGFNVTVRDRPDVRIKSGEIITIGRNNIAAIVPLTLPGNIISCNWSSQNGGALDDAASCEVIYAPPSADYDILRISMRSSCGLSAAVGQIRFSILP